MRHTRIPIILGAVLLGAAATAYGVVPRAGSHRAQTQLAADGIPSLLAPSNNLVSKAAAAGFVTDPTNASSDAVTAHADAVAPTTSAMSIDVGGHTLMVQRAGSATLDDGGQLWEGVAKDTAKAGFATAPADPADEVTLVRHGDEITGTVHTDGKLFRIQPVDGGGHTVTEVDIANLPPEHTDILPSGGARYDRDGPLPPKEAKTKADKAVKAAKKAAKRDRDAKKKAAKGKNVTIRVLVVGTAQAEKANHGAMKAMAQLAVAETNRGYQNSGVHITMKLAGYQTIKHQEAGFTSDLNQMVTPRDAGLKSMHKLRDKKKADLVVMLVSDRSLCGLGFLGATAERAFSVVSTTCATGLYSFAHEMGHNQGAQHDQATSPSQRPFPYGHGFRIDGQFRTIMAYACPRSCQRINYWSNPKVKFRGTKLGNSEISDNARVLNETAQRVSHFR